MYTIGFFLLGIFSLMIFYFYPKDERLSNLTVLSKYKALIVGVLGLILGVFSLIFS